jgi:hypothetical protein
MAESGCAPQSFETTRCSLDIANPFTMPRPLFRRKSESGKTIFHSQQ